MDELTNISMVMATPWWEILELSDIVAHLLFPKSPKLTSPGNFYSPG